MREQQGEKIKKLEIKMVEAKPSASSTSRKTVKLHSNSSSSDEDAKQEAPIEEDNVTIAKGIDRVKKELKLAEERRFIDQKYSLERYRELLEYFRDVQVMTPDTPAYLVEKIRNLAEFLVYGQKFDTSIYFEEFIEENVCQGHLTRFLSYKNRLVQIQII